MKPVLPEGDPVDRFADFDPATLRSRRPDRHGRSCHPASLARRQSLRPCAHGRLPGGRQPDAARGRRAGPARGGHAGGWSALPPGRSLG